MSSTPQIAPSTAAPARPRCRRVVDSRRRGRVVVVTAVCFFFIAQLVTSLLLDYVAPGVRFPALARVNERLLHGERSPEIVVVGSSHLEAFQSRLADALLARSFGDGAPTTFNASVPAGDPVVWERVLSDWSQRDYVPRLLLIEVSPEMLNRNDIWLDQQAMRVLNWTDFPDVVPPLCRNGRILALLNDRFLPVHLHRFQIRKQIESALFTETTSSPPPAGNGIEVSSADPAPPSMSQALQDDMRNSTSVVRKFVRNYSPRGMSAQRLEKLLADCRRQGVHTVVFVAPSTSGYRAGYSPECEADFAGYIGALRDRFHFTFVDWRTTLADEYFADSNHLNLAGSHVLSRRIAEEILAPAWRDLGERPARRVVSGQ